MKFRYLLSALALMPGAAVAQFAPMSCVANAPAPAIVRAEGHAELVSDLTIQCNAGTPTAAGTAIPQTTFTIFFNTNITSRLLATGWPEALALIDDPGGPANPAVPQLVCGDPGAPDGPPGVCAYTGTGTGIAYDGTPGHPNVFQGQQLSNNSLTFTLPLDQPGDLKSHTIRFTNLRAAASMLGQIMPPAFGHIMSIVSASGPMPVPIAFPTQTIGYSQVSLITKPGSGPTLKGCVPQNTGLLDGGKGGTAQFTIRVEEHTRRDWLKRSTAPYGGPNVSPSPAPFTTPGVLPLDSETFFFNPAFPTIPGRGNIRESGLADQGTRIGLVFTGIPPGVHLFTNLDSNMSYVPSSLPSPGNLRMISPGAMSGAGPFVPASGVGGLGKITEIIPGFAAAYFEVLNSDPFQTEYVDLPIYVAYQNAGAAIVQLDGTFAPISGSITASQVESIPRFGLSVNLQAAFKIAACK